MDRALALLEKMESMITTSAEFQASSDAAGEDDIRFLWDVQIIRGKSTFFGRIAGSSTLPGLLAPSQIGLSSEKAGNEMIAKVAGPVASKFQDLLNSIALEVPEGAVTPKALPAAYPPTGLPLGDTDLSMEAEIISQQGSP